MPDDRAIFTIYNLTTGALGTAYDVLAIDAEANTPAGFDRIDGRHDPQTHYVVDGAVVEKSTAAPTVSGLSVTGLPVPCHVVILPDGDEVIVDDGSLEVDADMPGPYRLFVRSVTHLDFWVTLE